MTPYETVVEFIKSLTWPTVVLGFLGVSGSISALGWKLRGGANRLQSTENYVEQMATNDFPHTFHTLLNIDKNIAKFTGGTEVNFTELEAALAAKRAARKK
ncbi:MAG TPA: hypothetical protein VN577_10140 [Terriglobales bacterium]|nr:hypothetical protein [Terriglobales bacterium]